MPFSFNFKSGAISRASLCCLYQLRGHKGIYCSWKQQKHNKTKIVYLVIVELATRNCLFIIAIYFRAGKGASSGIDPPGAELLTGMGSARGHRHRRGRARLVSSSDAIAARKRFAHNA